MDNRFENFTVSILKLNRLVHKIKLHEMSEYGLKAIHVMCIYYLNTLTDKLTASELAKLTLEDKAAISRALSALAAKNYVTYTANGYNAVIELTDSGKVIAEKINEKAARAVEAAGGDLTDEQRTELYKSLYIIQDNLENYYKKISAD